eukprot:CAMPEP_0182430912 /NCGR_PEP_ID=MMETSP1167-20130531/44712_1 /TAXON_ID=2988 /ORGANISM="Mallomonas Sp, Strain CCMP3275" /LENGTH=326 /DNA_ID=CAMNT_0024616591 /DNA_START=166 /DNA_END=1143 /DNA_ORIENTATION=+
MGEGIEKLTEYLNQTRRQAEISIECLNQRVIELEHDCDLYKKNMNKLKEERDYYDQLVEQLKIENSKKWRLQERDDWKALVDSVQQDRDRLHDENVRLITELDQANAFIEQQEILLAQGHSADELMEQEQQQHEEEEKDEERTVESPTRRRSSSSNSEEGEHTQTQNLAADETAQQMDDDGSAAVAGVSSPSPISVFIPTAVMIPEHSQTPGHLSRSRSTSAGCSSPRSDVRLLRAEIVKLSSQREVERAAAETERLALEDEITRLREELEHCTCRHKSLPGSEKCAANGTECRTTEVASARDMHTPLSNGYHHATETSQERSDSW